MGRLAPNTAHDFATSLTRRADIGVWRTHCTDIEVMRTFAASWSLTSCRPPFPARRDAGQLVDGIRLPVVMPSGEAGTQMRSAAAVLMSVRRGRGSGASGEVGDQGRPARSGIRGVRRGRGSGASGEVGAFKYSVPEQDAVDHQCIVVISHIQIDMTINPVP